MSDTTATADPAETVDLAESLAWLLPAHHGAPTVCLRRIRWLCEHVVDLHDAMLLVAATHQGIGRDRLAAAMHQFRPDLRSLRTEDVLGLVNGLVHGGRDGFDAVLRSRKTSERRSAPMPFLRPD